MKIYILCPVSMATETERKKLTIYAEEREALGDVVHLPHRDTDQTKSVLQICQQNIEAIRNADEVHIFFKPNSRGSLFDLGATMALKKIIRVINNVTVYDTRTFENMLGEWKDTQQITL